MKKTDTHTNQQNEAKQGLSKLPSEANRKRTFSVPADYFETLPTKIQERIAVEKRVPFYTNIGIRIKQPIWSVSISGIAIIILLAILFIPKADKNPDFDNQVFTLEEILNSEPGIIYEIDESQLIEVLIAHSGNDDEQKSDEDFNIKKDTSFSNDDIIDYLLENGIDESIIYNL
jgi:hypothetical protein